MLSMTRFWPSLALVTKCLDHRPECAFWCTNTKRHKNGCRRAEVDIPKTQDEICKKPCRQSIKPPGILHKIKLKVIEGGTNFGTPFWRLRCKTEPEVSKKGKPGKQDGKQKALPAPKKPKVKMPPRLPGLQVAVLGADTAIGVYVSLLLKQCSCIKRLRLYEAADNKGCNRNICQVADDLQHINTNCAVQAFSCAGYELERCLQNSDIVLILESSYVNADMPYDKRFYYQAPMIKCYSDAISNECPKAFIIVCATPVDCMVPLMAQSLHETGWYNPKKLMGSMAAPEMRASTLAARALSLEPRYTRVPCVGGSEGKTLVPLFSRAVEYFEFAQNNAMLMTQAVRNAPQSVARIDGGSCARAADLSEAHAVAGLVTKVAHALLCNDVPRVTGFVETDPSQVISPTRFIANQVTLSGTGIIDNAGLPKMNFSETTTLTFALGDLHRKMKMVEAWYKQYCYANCRLEASQLQFFSPTGSWRFDTCAHHFL